MIVDLYTFRIGDLHTLHYTTAQHDLWVEDQLYRSTWLRRGGVKATESMARSNVTINMPRDIELATLYTGNVPSQVTTVEIRQWDEFNAAVVYLGRVMSVKREGRQTIAECESVFTALQAAGLRRRMQRLCPFALYDGDCKADPDQFSVSATLSETTSSALTAPEFGFQDEGYFIGGYVEWGSGPERRAIIGHATDTITLASPLSGPQVGDSVVAFAGCDHSFPTCRDKFDNADNFGGMPWIPRKNPFGSDPIF